MEVFNKMGCGLTANDEGDELIRLQGLDERPFTFDQNDRFRHVKTGLLPDIIPEVLLIISLILNAVTLTLIVGHNAAICSGSYRNHGVACSGIVGFRM